MYVFNTLVMGRFMSMRKAKMHTTRVVVARMKKESALRGGVGGVKHEGCVCVLEGRWGSVEVKYRGICQISATCKKRSHMSSPPRRHRQCS